MSKTNTNSAPASDEIKDRLISARAALATAVAKRNEIVARRDAVARSGADALRKHLAEASDADVAVECAQCALKDFEMALEEAVKRESETSRMREHAAAKSKRDAVAEKIGKRRREIEAEIIGLMTEARTADDSIRRVNANLPAGAKRIPLLETDPTLGARNRKRVAGAAVLDANYLDPEFWVQAPERAWTATTTVVRIPPAPQSDWGLDGRNKFVTLPRSSAAV